MGVDGNNGLMRIAVFCSGNGSNFEVLCKNEREGALSAAIVLMVTDNPKAYAIDRAVRLGVPTLVLDPNKFSSKLDYEKALCKELRAFAVDLIALAGFMRIISPYLISKYRWRIINIHPSLLPAFKGAHAIKDAFAYGVRVSGVTVHFVDETVDGGPIIAQAPVKLSPNDTMDSFERKIHKAEHKLYTQALNEIIKRQWKVEKKRRLVFLD